MRDDTMPFTCVPFQTRKVFTGWSEEEPKKETSLYKLSQNCSCAISPDNDLGTPSSLSVIKRSMGGAYQLFVHLAGVVIMNQTREGLSVYLAATR